MSVKTRYACRQDLVRRVVVAIGLAGLMAASPVQAADLDPAQSCGPNVPNPDAIAAVEAGARTVAETLGDEPLDALVNNAGVAVLGPLQLLSLERYREQFEVNVLGMIAVTQAFLPLLGARPDFRGTPGRIVNISSTYGVLSYPLMSPYSGSKHAIEGVTGCLRAELKAYGIDVILVGPGPVKSRIWRKNEALDFTYARGTRYEEPIRRLLAMQDKGERYGMSEARLGRRLRKIIESRHPRARYAPVVFSLYLWVLPRITPPWLLDRITARQLGL